MPIGFRYSFNNQIYYSTVIILRRCHEKDCKNMRCTFNTPLFSRISNNWTKNCLCEKYCVKCEKISDTHKDTVYSINYEVMADERDDVISFEIVRAFDHYKLDFAAQGAIRFIIKDFIDHSKKTPAFPTKIVI